MSIESEIDILTKALEIVKNSKLKKDTNAMVEDYYDKLYIKDGSYCIVQETKDGSNAYKIKQFDDQGMPVNIYLVNRNTYDSTKFKRELLSNNEDFKAVSKYLKANAVEYNKLKSVIDSNKVVFKVKKDKKLDTSSTDVASISDAIETAPAKKVKFKCAKKSLNSKTTKSKEVKN